MITKTHILVVIVVCAAVIACACIDPYSLGLGGEKTASISVSTDKDIYKSLETMTITVSVDYFAHLNDTLVRVRGVTSSRGSHLLNRENTVGLSPGVNNITFTYTVPSCSACSGISPGPYYINATVTRGNLTLGRANHTVVIGK